MSFQALADFLTPISVASIMEDEGFKDNQLGRHILLHETAIPDISTADLVLVGCCEMRGAGPGKQPSNAADCIRKELYQLFHWHADVQLADLGNIRAGSSLQDSYAAMKTVVKELVATGK